MDAVTHVLVPIVIVDLFRDYILPKAKQKILTNHYIFLVGIFGALPDIDIPISWVLKALNVAVPNWLTHGHITHSIFIPIILFPLALIAYKLGKRKWFLILLMATIGFSFHIGLDLLSGGVTPFYPFATSTIYGIYQLSAFHRTGLDAILLIGWLFHEEYTHKIKSYF